ncbi:MAG: hypothetical protein E3J88_03290 [Anaerolineales bacterium]|nr:MAG: hypothetical protein E3J88_03290 [Anaerolineales bacterium]
MDKQQIINWLLEGDVAIQYQVHRDLLASEKPHLQDRIASEGWGAKFLSFRKEEGHWGRGFYQPKWISSHYTILDLKNLGISPGHPDIIESVLIILRDHKAIDGGIDPSVTIDMSDVCINGMVLNYASYFKVEGEALQSIVDNTIEQHMHDGGFNCRANRQGAVHSSLHSTISVLEGIQEYGSNNYVYRLAELEQIAAEAREFILQHHLYRSDRTGEIIDKRMLMLSYPSRWQYDILRALDYFQGACVDYDPRMQPALDVLLKKRRKDNRWPVQAKHPGQIHFEMEKTGGPSRWNTLRSLRVLKHFGLSEAI